MGQINTPSMLHSPCQILHRLSQLPSEFKFPILPTILIESDSFGRKKRGGNGGLNTQIHPQATFSLDGLPFLLSYF